MLARTTSIIKQNLVEIARRMYELWCFSLLLFIYLFIYLFENNALVRSWVTSTRHSVDICRQFRWGLQRFFAEEKPFAAYGTVFKIIGGVTIGARMAKKNVKIWENG